VNTKTTIESALGMLTTMSFAIPTAGPGIAAGLAGVEFFVKLLYPDPTPPSPPVDHAELKKELSDLLGKIADLIQGAKTDDITNALLAVTDAFADAWAGMGKISVDCATFALGSQDPNTKAWSNGYDPTWYEKTTNYYTCSSDSILYTLLKYQGHFTNASVNDSTMHSLDRAEQRTATTAALCLVNALVVTYLKMCAVWGWGRIMIRNAQYEAYKAAVEDWKKSVKKNPAFATTLPLAQKIAELDALYPDLNYIGYKPKTWDLYVNDPDCPVGLMKKYVDRMVKYCVEDKDKGTDGLCTILRKNWDDMVQKVSSYDVSPADPAGPSITEIVDAIEKGRKRATDWSALIEKYAFVGVTADDIVKFEKNIALWRSVKASMSFYTYQVKTGDTLAGIAQNQYNDASLSTAIYDHNRDQLKDPNIVPAGILLKIYHKEDLPYVSSDTLDPSKPVTQ
jgi:hypothetical protein